MVDFCRFISAPQIRSGIGFQPEPVALVEPGRGIASIASAPAISITLSPNEIGCTGWALRSGKYAVVITLVNPQLTRPWRNPCADWATG